MSVRIAIRTVLLHLGIAAVCLVAPQTISAAPPSSTAPNILIILTDDQGRGDYSAFGTKDIRTPNMDRLFREGMYEGGLRVPGAARYPGRIQPGSHTERITLTMDIFATVCDALAVRPPPDIDGLSFWPTLLGQSMLEPKRDLYFVRREGGVAYGGKTIEAYRRGNWKLLQDSPFAPLELYDLKSDPLETTNLAANERRVFNQLAARLRKQLQHGGQVPWQPPPRSP